MKKTLLITSALISLNGLSQQLDASNEPTIGQSQTMYVCDTLTPSYDATVGSGVTWDYSAILGLNSETQTIEVLDATTSPNAADFPTSTKAIGTQGSFINYFNSTSAERVSQGFVYDEPSFGTVLAQFNTDEQVVMDYPFANGDYRTDAFSGELNFTFNGLPQNPACTGNSYAWIDGQGTLLLPNSTSYSNVIRYKIIDTVFTQVVFVVPLDIEFIRTQYEYYSTTTSELPLFTHSAFKIQQAGATTPLLSQNVVLSTVQPESNLGLTENMENEFSVYPNPSEGQVRIKGTFSSESVINIFDQSGRLVGSVNDVTNNMNLDLSDLNQGIYTLQLIDHQNVSTKMISIK